MTRLSALVAAGQGALEFTARPAEQDQPRGRPLALPSSMAAEPASLPQWPEIRAVSPVAAGPGALEAPAKQEKGWQADHFPALEGVSASQTAWTPREAPAGFPGSESSHSWQFRESGLVDGRAWPRPRPARVAGGSC
jgi:hypothetical protein